RIIFGLSLTAGLADVSLLKTTSAFPTMMTGNTMKFLEALLNLRYEEAAFFISLVGIYTAATAGYRVLSNEMQRRGKELGNGMRLSTPRVLSPIVLALFLLSDTLLSSPRPTLRLLSFAYGLINSVSIESAGTITCMLTGHMHKLANAFAEGKLWKDKVQRRSAAVLAGFAGGACLSVVGFKVVPGFMGRGLRTTLGAFYFTLLALLNDKGGIDTNVLGRRECVIDEYDAGCKE
ncbi:hypothetical protein TrRE_jg12904, partial [Triparma retinervis]